MSQAYISGIPTGLVDDGGLLDFFNPFWGRLPAVDDHGLPSHADIGIGAVW
jgi:hypothetical protein